MHTSLINVYLGGVALLIAAIAMNLVAKSFQLKTWYDYILYAKDAGIGPATSSLGVASAVFLFGVYPLVLGLVIELIIAKR